MKWNPLTIVALAAALASPVAATAQQAQQPPGTQQGQARTTPSEAKITHRWMKRLGNLNLSSDQQQRVQSLINQYSQAHPEGSPRDPSAARALRQQIMGVLSADQQNQYRQQVQAHRQQQASQHGQAGAQTYQGQYQQQGPAEQYQQQGPPQQYQQQGPPQQYQQQGPPQQGPPQDQQPPSYAQPPAQRPA
jgi:hypothetical protein